MSTNSDPSPSSADPPSVSPLMPQPPVDNLLPKFSFPVMKPRSKRKPVKFSETCKKEDGFEVGSVSNERPWKLRSIGLRRKQRTSFSLPLSTDEIAEDIYAVTGSRPRRRPKKRPRHVQKQIDMVFPGLWLSEVTAELYRVAEDR